MERNEVAIIGAGQAGLALSHELTLLGVDHVVLERGQIGEAWLRRWDSFCLVTPNWSVRLPGFPYDGPAADGFMPRDEIVAYLRRYAASFGAPVREHTGVEQVRETSDGFLLATTSGSLLATSLVVATGANQRPHRIAGVGALPAHLLQIDALDYHNAAALPDGDVLVIGSGQSGVQIAEEVRSAERNVVLACGRAAWLPRRVADHDIVWWLQKGGFFDLPVRALPSPDARLLASPQVTGQGGGRDLNLRTLRALGVKLAGHFHGASERGAFFAPDLAQSVVWGDARHDELMDLVYRVAKERGMDQPVIEPPARFDPRAPDRIDLTRFGAVILAGGFRPDYGSLLPWPEALDSLGFAVQRDGASAVIPGLFFIGAPFLRTRKSSLLMGVGEDAVAVAHKIVAGHVRQAGVRESCSLLV